MAIQEALTEIREGLRCGSTRHGSPSRDLRSCSLLALPHQASDSAWFTAQAALNVAPFFALSIALAAYAKASGAENLIARAFTGPPGSVMIVVASLMGALSPFCSCGVIPVIAALLATGVPLAPVMAFWLASPLMDPSHILPHGGRARCPVCGGEDTCRDRRRPARRVRRARAAEHGRAHRPSVA